MSKKKKHYNFWNAIKNLSVGISLFLNLTLILVVILFISHKIYVTIDQDCSAVIKENVSMNVPVTFSSMDKVISMSGKADVTLTKGINLPAHINLTVPVEKIKFSSVRRSFPVSIKIK
jgi:hypothetical protein